MTQTPQKKKIWIFAFEYAGVAKVGGLGEVSSNQCRSLVSEPNLNLQVFIPSHNTHIKLSKTHGFSPIMEASGKKLVLRGHIDPLYFGIKADMYDVESDPTLFEIEVWRGKIDNVSINLLVGANSLASVILHDSEVYSSKTLDAKLGLFALAMKEYMRYCIFDTPEIIPDIIHIHDHHPVCALLNCRQQLLESHRDVKTIITMHLLTWPRKNLTFFWKSGVNNEPMSIQVGQHRSKFSVRDLFALINTEYNIPPTLEKFGCVFADQVIAVSQSFLLSDIIPNCGGKFIQEKCDFTWNGCDWDYNSIFSNIWDRFQGDFPNLTPDTIHSWDFRRIFLTNEIGVLAESEPKIHSPLIREFVSNQFYDAPYHNDCTVDAFEEDGPMVLITGRVTPQKGVETILDAIPSVTAHFPKVKFIFLMVPTAFTLPDLQKYMEIAYKYPKNIRFIFGIAGSIYFLAHLSADIYCCPSRWEPFGIVALEAMASGIPIVATDAGGLKESIISLEKDIEKGTGLLVPIDNSQALSRALISLLSVMTITEQKLKGNLLDQGVFLSYLSKIIYPELRDKIKLDSEFGEKIRRNAMRRVQDNFRWNIVSEKLKKIYFRLSLKG